MANKKQNAFPVKLDKQRKIRFTFNAFCELEEVMDRPLTELQNGFKMKDLRALVWAGLLHEEPDLTLEDAGAMIDEAESIEEVAQVVGKALEAAFGSKKKDAEPGK
jgi:hypothetical protein